MAEDVGIVAADAGDLAVGDLDLQPAGRLAEWAGTDRSNGLGHSNHLLP